jgi:undecaprenyl-diphosphatase
MGLGQAIILALIQGLTEFLPVSSSAHLILFPILTDWPDQGLAFDVALNTATWLAVVIYLRKDLFNILHGLWLMIGQRKWHKNHNGHLALMIILGTVPVATAGFFAHDFVAYRLRTLEVIAFSSIIWGLVLWIADRRPGINEVSNIRWLTALGIGIAQALALIPGTSRSGITITAGLFLGLSRTAAARFSFLLAVVVGGLAGGMEGINMVEMGSDTSYLAVFVGFVVAFVSAYLAIHYFLKLLSRTSMTPFVVYRVLLGCVLLAIFR